MKRILSASFIFLFFFSAGNAQNQPDHFVYAITSMQKGGTDWVCLRKLDTQTGQFSVTMINGTNENTSIYDAFSQKKINSFENDTFANSSPQLAFGSGVAAIAYDKQTNRLFYAPMLINELRYIDLNTMKIYSVPNQSFAKAGNFDYYAGAISRMVIAPDGYGYTLTNDGSHLLRFNTSGDVTISDLGEVSDAATNKETIHNFCSNSGGDLVADEDGNLYLISAIGRVFKINVNSRNTEYLGTVTGLPQNFTTNGAAVDENGNLIVSSSQYTEAFFSVDPKTWAASLYLPINEMFSSADLANSNTIHAGTTTSMFKNFFNDNSDKIKVFPNPVMNNTFSVQFNNLQAGNYTVQVTDEFGNAVSQQTITVSQMSQTQTVNISAKDAQSLYFLRIVDENNIKIFSQIIVVERL